MKRRSVYLLIATILAILVPSPGRFVYGVTLILELNILMLIGTLAISLVKKLKLEEINTLIVIIVIIGSTVMFRQIMIMLYPEIMLTLGFLVYLMPVSFFLIGYVFTNMDEPVNVRINRNMFHIMTFSVYALLFFLLRDIAGYGTFTFFGKNHQILEKVIINEQKIGFFSIFASIPGAMILSAILLFIHIYVRNQIAIYKRAEVKN